MGSGRAASAVKQKPQEHIQCRALCMANPTPPEEQTDDEPAFLVARIGDTDLNETDIEGHNIDAYISIRARASLCASWMARKSIK